MCGWYSGYLVQGLGFRVLGYIILLQLPVIHSLISFLHDKDVTGPTISNNLWDFMDVYKSYAYFPEGNSCAGLDTRSS